MSKGTIIYLGGFDLPDKNAAAQRVISVSKSLISLGYDILLLGLSKDLTYGDGIIEIESNITNIRMLQKAYPTTRKQWLKHIIYCNQEINLISSVSSVKAVICYNYPAVLLWKINKYCISHKIKLIADITEWYESANKGLIYNLVKSIDTNLRMKYVHAKLDNVMCISRYLQNYYKTRVPNCILVPGTIDKKDDKWNQLKKYMPNEVFTLGYAGNPGDNCEKERIDLLIKAICQLNEEGNLCYLNLAGFDKKQFELNYPQLLDNRYYNKCIFYLGKVSHKECLQLISNVDFSVIIREDKLVTRAGFPTKLSESFACGTPVIATSTSNVSEFIIDDKNGLLVEDCSYQELIKIIRKAVKYKYEKLIEMHAFTRENNQLVYEEYNNLIGAFINNEKETV